MTRKIVTGIIAAVLLVTIAVFAAEKAKEKAFAEKPRPKAKAGERPALSTVERFGQREGLLDQLAEAYKANDREKMSEIINKMQERREEMQEHAKFNRWHKEAHRRMMGPCFAPNCGAMQGRQMGPGWGQGRQMAGPGWNQCCAMNGPCGNCGWAMRGRGPNQGCPMAAPQCGQFQAMRGRGFDGCNNMTGNCGAMTGGFGQMPCREREMNVPPPEWGW